MKNQLLNRKSVTQLLSLCAFLLLCGTTAKAQFIATAPTINSAIGTNEYGNHTIGSNAWSDGTRTYYMTWDNTNLYVAVANNTNATTDEFVLYIDTDPQAIVNGGTDANGCTGGIGSFDGNNYGVLPFRANFNAHIKNSGHQHQTNDTNNTWLAQTNNSASITKTTTGNLQEFSIAWSLMPGGVRPSSFNFFFYLNGTNPYGGLSNYSTTTDNDQSNNANLTGRQYFSVANTADTTSTLPFSRLSYVNPNGVNTLTNYGTSFYDVTLNAASTTTSLGANVAVSNLFHIASTNTLAATGAARTITFSGASSTLGLQCEGAITQTTNAVNVACTSGITTLRGSASNTNYVLGNVTVSAGATLQAPSTGIVDVGLQTGTILVQGTLNFVNGSGVVNLTNNGLTDSDVTLNVQSAGSANLNNFTNNGVTGSSIILANPSTNPASALSFNNITNNANNTIIPFNGGVSTTSVPMTIRGNLTNNGTFTTTSGTTFFRFLDITVTGSASTLTSASLIDFRGLTIANTGSTSSNAIGVTLAITGTSTIVTKRTLTINSGARLILTTGALNITASAIATVNGFLRSNQTITTNSNLTFSSTGFYEHNFTTTAGVIPTATWNVGSTCAMIGYTLGATFGISFSQPFHHFTWNCPNQQAGNTNLFGALTTVKGNFSVLSTGVGTLVYTNPDATLAVDGDFIMAGGTFNLNNGAGTTTLNILGNFNQTGGLITRGGTAGIIKFIKSSGTQTFSQSAPGALSGAYVIDVGNGTTTNTLQLVTNVNLGGNAFTFNVLNNATVDFQTFQLQGAHAGSSFTSAAGATLISAQTTATEPSGAFRASGNQNGSVATNGTKTYDPGTNYTFNGASAQATGGGLITAANLNINNSSALNLSANTTVTGTLTVPPSTILRLAGGFNLTVSSASNNSVAGTIEGLGSLIKTGGGVLTLSATTSGGNNTANTYAGGTTITAASSGSINVTGLNNITSAVISRDTQVVTFSSPTPPTGTYRLLPGALTVNTQSFSHNATPAGVIFNYPNSTVIVGTAIGGAATAAAFTTTYGAASAVQAFNVFGGGLTANLVATAPAGFEVSSDGITYGSTATFIQTSGAANGSLRIRLAATAPVLGSYNSNSIVLSSTGATNVNIVTAASGNVVSARALTITANSFTKQFGSTVLTGAGSNFFAITAGALQNGETISITFNASGGELAGAAVGTYTTIPTLATGGTFNAANYTITYATGTLTVAAPTLGNYRSKASGDWADINTWQVWNGAWVDVTTQGYPLQNVDVFRVDILNNHNVTCGISANSFTPRAQRIEVQAGANDTSLTFIGSPYFELNSGSIVLSSSGGGSALLDVGNANIYTFNQLQLGTPNGGGACSVLINNGSLSLGGNIAMFGNAAQNSIQFYGSGKLTSGGSISGGTIVAGTGTVQYASAANRPVQDYTFYNLVLSGGTAIKTFDAGTLVTNSLTILGTARAGLPNGSNYTIPSLVYGTSGQLAGTYGSTASLAILANRSDVFFNVATTGIITVTSNIPEVAPNIGAYSYTGLAQGPDTATSSGTPAPMAGDYSYSYAGASPTVYGPSPVKPTAAGTYTVTVTVVAVSPWEASSSPAIGFTIYPRSLTITANSPIKQFGSTVLTGAGSNFFTSTGLQNGETIGSITFNSTGAAAGAAGGTYPTIATAATGGTFNADNYAINYVNGLLTVATPTVGSYRSKASTDWTMLSTWERWNGTNWVEPISTTPEGYPTQFGSPSRVDILDSHNVTCGITSAGANRPKRIEIQAGANNTSLTFTTTNYFEVDGAIFISAPSTGNAFLNVNAATVNTNDNVTLGDTPGAATDCEVVITTGSMTLFSGNLAMFGAANENALRLGSGYLKSNFGISGGTIDSGTGTVEYGGAAQTVRDYAFYNLILKGSGIKTVTEFATIAGNLTIDGTASASLFPGKNYTVGTLTLGCRDSENGTWGSAGPNPDPTYVDTVYLSPPTTYFQNTTGYITVTTDTSLKIPVNTNLQPTCLNPTVVVTIDVQYPNQEYSFDNGANWSPSNVSPTALVPGTYTIRIKNSRGCHETSKTITLVTPIKTWTGPSGGDWNNAANWSPTGIPTADTCVEISTTVNITGSGSTGMGHNLTVSAGGNLTVASTNSLKITDFVNVNALGSLTFLNNSSLVQINDVVNTGNINYRRTTPSVIETDYIYWSSPVVGSTLSGVSPTDYSGGYFYSFDSSVNNWKAELPSKVMDFGVGYIMRAQKPNNDPFTIDGLFTGIPHNGAQTVPTGPVANSVLLGNPYPSAIDADEFLAANNTKIEGTIYFWTHNTDTAIGAAYTSNDYASYNGIGGVATLGNFRPEWVDTNGDRIVDLSEFTDRNGDSSVNTIEWTDGGILLRLETGDWADTNKNNIAETGEWTDLNNDGVYDELPIDEWTDSNNNFVKDFGEWISGIVDNTFNTGEWNDVNKDKKLNLEVEQILNKPTGKIATGQGFFATSLGGADQFVSFDNTMRLDGSGNPYNNSNFYKTKDSKTVAIQEKSRIWLNMTNTGGAFKQTLLGYVTDATNEIDSRFDGESLDGNDFIDFYSINQNKNLTIQGRALPFDQNDEVPLGYRSTIAGEFKIDIDQVDGLLANQAVFIEDKLTKTITKLTTSAHTFNTAIGTFNNRFVLRFNTKTLGNNEFDNLSNKVLVSVKNKQIKINSFTDTMDKVEVYDLLGRKIYQEDHINSNELVLSTFVSSRHQTLIVKTILQNGKTVTEKVIY